MRYLALLIILVASVHAKQCTFTPPPGWEMAQLKVPSPHVKIGFIGKGSTDFRPSINLALEEVDVPLKEYIKAVKEIQQSEPNNKWRDLGKLPTQAGTGRLTEMTNQSAWGEIKVYQAIFVESGMAYILTAAVLKDDFPKFQTELLKSFRSLTLMDDIWSPISDVNSREQFHQLFLSLGSNENRDQEWENLQSQVKSHAELGTYWQFLALQEGHSKIYASAALDASEPK